MVPSTHQSPQPKQHLDRISCFSTDYGSNPTDSKSTMAIEHIHPFSRTTRVSRYQKGKTNLDFTAARDSEWQWHQLGHICKCAPSSTQITMPAPHHSVFYRPDALPAAQPTASKHSRPIELLQNKVRVQLPK